ncbi:hypothetical protein [Streptomyces chartreusis]
MNRPNRVHRDLSDADGTLYKPGQRRLRVRASYDLSSQLVPSEGVLELYALLVAEGPTSRTQVDADQLAALEAAGLAKHIDGVVETLAPFAAIDAMTRAGADAATHLREATSALEQAWQSRPHREGTVEFVQGAESAAALAAIIAESNDVCGFNRVTSSNTPKIVAGALDGLAQGMTIRIVYDSGLLANEAVLAVARACVAAGEQARVLPGVPVSMLIGDFTGSLSLPGSQGPVPDRVIFRAPRLLTALRDVFESLWDKAIPISETPWNSGDQRSAEDRLLLSLLSVGLSDLAIGRELGISERTVRRRIAHLQGVLGAKTRFQLGVQAARQGWFSDL